MGTKFNLRDKLMRTASVACTGDPQVGACAALKQNNLQAFSDILNTCDVEEGSSDPTHWINLGIKEEDGLSLVEMCVERGEEEYVDLLTRLGVRADILNPATGLSALHRAVQNGRPDLLRVLMACTRADFDVNVRAGQLKRGYSPLHLAVQEASDQHLQCLEILLGNIFIDLDARDRSGSVSPLYLAAKHQNARAAKRLIEEGANINAKVGKTDKTVREFVQLKLPSLEIDKIRVKKPRTRDETANVTEKMLEIIQNTNYGAADYFKQFLQFRQVSLSVRDASSGVEHLVEKACRKGLAEFAQVLFSKGASPDRFGAGSLSAPVFDAAERADYHLLATLKRAGADFTAVKAQTDETVLHSLLKNYHSEEEVSFVKALRILLAEEDQDFRHKVKSIVNRKDISGNTALHYATEKWPDWVVRQLLQAGANIGVKNWWGELPISRIQPELLETFLDEDCLGSKGEIYHKDLEITFKYEFLAPDPLSLPESFRPSEPLAECQPLDKTSKPSRSFEVRNALPETESLWYMGESKEHRHLLRHPVISSFLWFKWERMRPYFNRNLRLYLLFVYMLTWYIFTHFGGYSQQEAIRESFYSLYILFFIWTCLLMSRDWLRAIQQAVRIQTADEDSGIYQGQETSSSKLVAEVLWSNWLDLIQISGMVIILLIDTHHISIVLLVLVGVLVVRETLQMLVSVKRYFTSLENWIEITMIGLVLAIIFNNDPQNYQLNRHLAAIALVLSWTELVTMIGRHPKLLHFNVYVTMFYKVLNSFLMFLLWYSLFIIAFGFGFYIMLHDDTQMDGSGLEEDDKNQLFNRTWLTLAKTSAMFIGELEFSDLPINSETYLGMLAYSYFLVYVFLIVVVLMNLLNGLAVSDTGDIKAKAEIYSYISRVETISYMESTLLGDPFDFLSNVPRLLARFPSISLVRQFHRSDFCRRVFTKLGAKSFLLFYTYLPDKAVKIRPNRPTKYCSLGSDQMGQQIIQAAKDIIRRRKKEVEEKKVDDIQELQERLKEINTKLDILLKKK